MYEALTGKKAFVGETVTDTLAQVVQNEPDWARAPASVLPTLKRCLAKDVRSRLHAIADARVELGSLPEAVVDGAPAAHRRWPLVAAACVLGLGVGFLLWRDGSAPEVVERRLHVRLGDAPLEGIPVLSPDGSRIGFGAGGQNYLRRLDEEHMELLSFPNGVTNLFFSPDGEWVGAYGAVTLRKSSVRGGAVTILVNASLSGRAVWGDDGYIYYTIRGGRGIFRVGAEGGEPEEVSAPETGRHIQPEIVSGGETLLYVVLDSNNRPTHVEALSLASGQRTTLISSATSPRYVPTGHLTFVRDGALMAGLFDSQTLAIRGSAVKIEEDVARAQTFYGQESAYSFSGNGLLAYRERDSASMGELVWVNRNGAVELVGLPSGNYEYPELSPDARAVAVNEAGQVWIYDLTRGTRVRLTSAGAAGSKAWTPDGRRLVFGADRGGIPNLFSQAADGSGAPELLAESAFAQFANGFSRDGRLAFSQTDENNHGGIWTMIPGGEPELFLSNAGYTEGYGRLSPDGKWMAYGSNVSGQYEVYVRPFPEKVLASRSRPAAAGRLFVGLATAKSSTTRSGIV